MLLRCLPALVLLALPAGALPAQQWRTVDVSRQLRDSSAHDVRIRYGAGTLSLRPTEDPVLFTMHMRYDEESVTPVHRYDAQDHSLTLGLSDVSIRGGGNAGREPHGELRVALSQRVPMTLDLALGAAQAQLELGGLALRAVKIETGASASRVRFGAPNPARMRTLEVSAGAASVHLQGLSNANVDEVRVAGGVGSVNLEFGSALARDVDVDAEMALGKVTVRVPPDAGVRVELSRFIAGFDHFGLRKRGDAWYSDNWDRAAHRVSIRVKTVFGSVAVLRDE
jgi:hypothetical protein